MLPRLAAVASTGNLSVISRPHARPSEWNSGGRGPAICVLMSDSDTDESLRTIALWSASCHSDKVAYAYEVGWATVGWLGLKLM